MIDLDNLKKVFQEYHYPWINPINGKEFNSRNLLLGNLKKYLTKEEYEYVYPSKYVRIQTYNMCDIIKNTRIDNNKILSPLDSKWYGPNAILSHLSCFFNDNDKINILYEIFKHNKLVPKCCHTNKFLEAEDIMCGKNLRTRHPDNVLFSKYSSKLNIEDYREIHSKVLKSPHTVEKRKKEKENFLKDENRVKAWKEKTKHTHSLMDHPWLTDISKEERERRNIKSSTSQKHNILKGTFTPQNNYRTKRRIELEIEGRKYYFRSSWEVCFFVSNEYLDYETLRIEYIKDNECKIYIPDFIDNKNKIIYELKPKRQYVTQKEKMNGAIKWCLNNNYRFMWVNEFNICNYINKAICSSEKYSIYYNKMLKGILTQ
jgi:hypothetical protein